jgi:hypothetical protein
MATLPQTQEEARKLILQKQEALRKQYSQEQAAGTLTRTKEVQIRQQFQDLGKQLQVAQLGTAGSAGKGLLSGVRQNFDFMGRGLNVAAPILSMPAQVSQALTNYRFGRQVNEPQSQEQLVPFRTGQGVGSIAAGLLTPGNTAKTIATAAGLTAADIGIEATGGPQSLASGAYLLSLLTKGGWQGMKNWREGRKFDDLMKNLPPDMPELEKNALKRFMLTGQGSDNGIVAAAMQKLETKPEFAEMLKKLREGATEQTLSGMRPETGRLTKEQTATGFVQTLQNKLDGLKETVAKSIFDPERLSLYDKAKGYGGGRSIVDPANTVNNIDKLIAEFQAKKTPDADNSVKALTALRERFAPTFTTEARGATTTSMASAARDTLTNAPIPGQAVNYTTPGAPSVTIQQNVRPVTVETVQGVLSEFGKKAAQGDSLFKDISITSEQRINAAIFGGMKDDLRISLGTAKEGTDKAAVRILSDARDKTAVATQRYNDAISQGMPAFLKGSTAKEINFPTLVTEYEKLTPNQRASVRQWVGDTDPEVLKQFDRQIYTNFLDKARDADGAVDLGKLTSLWNSTKTADRDAVTTALGVNAGEFNARMRDATAFNNRIRVAQPAVEASDVAAVAPSAARLAGATLGYGAHQGVMLSADIAKQLLDKTKLTDDQLMKLLLSTEGADFLKTQKLTPGSAQLLDKFTQVTTPSAPATGTVQQVGAQLQEPTVPEQAAPPTAVVIPSFEEEPTMPTAPQAAPNSNQVVIPNFDE